ncbi:tetratricopeptide repeat protein [Nitratifractor sp.]
MEEITLRFEIIRLAVKLGDFETLGLQVRKLRDLSFDENLDAILDLLESKNYRQALYEMKRYRPGEGDAFFAEKPKQARRSRRRVDEGAGLFDSFEDTTEAGERVLDVEDMLRLAQWRKRHNIPVHEETNVSSHREETLSPTPKSDDSVVPSKAARGMEKTDVEIPGHSVQNEAEFETVQSHPLEGASSQEESQERAVESFTISETERESVEAVEKITHEVHAPEGESDTHYAGFSEEVETKNDISREADAPGQTRSDEAKEGTRYPPISYIDQKFRNMTHQFPPLERPEVMPPEVDAMRKKIAEEGYTDKEIERFLAHYERYKQEGKIAEAAQVLLLAAATESKFAQFLLARELFRGDVIEQDYAESFTQINTLADQGFAEAICDLGQFYEYGIGIGKDREMALLLYEEAAELGVKRARRHYERLKNAGGLKGLFKKLSVPPLSLKVPQKSS